MNKIITSKIGKTIYIISVLIIIYCLFIIYKTFSFGDFTKGEFITGLTKFRRDAITTCEYGHSYRLESIDFNDAMFYKTVKVKPNTPYKLTCMVKTDSVITQDGRTNGGAQISILDSLECSRSVTGTNDWQELEFIFDSKDRDTIEIGFRLGGNSNKARGTAWFSDFKLEEGLKDNSNNWNVACFIIKNVDVNIDNENLKVSMSVNDIEKMKLNMDRFKIAANELSNGKMTVDYDIYEINEPIKTITYSEQYGYYVDPVDVEEILKNYLNKEEYDYIFVTTRLGDMDEDIEIPVYDWIGLGGMDLYGIGYSNIRLPNDKSSYIYTYDPSINTFPEEVFIHEFLHSLERILQERNYDIPELHDYDIYGYENEKLIGLKKWYGDYMTKEIKTSEGRLVGLDEIVYTLTPPAESDFRYSLEVQFNDEPDNPIEEIRTMWDIVLRMFGAK